MSTGDQEYSMYPTPHWQWFPPHQIYPLTYPEWPQPYVYPDTCPMCGRAYSEVLEIKMSNASSADEKIEEIKQFEGLNGGHYVDYKPDDYVTVTDISKDGSSASLSMIRKPDCWGDFSWCEVCWYCHIRKECEALTEREVEVEQMLEDFDADPKPRFFPGEPVDEEAWQAWVDRRIADHREGMEELARSAGND